MRRFILAAAFLLLGSTFAVAQPLMRPCVTTGNIICLPISASNPLPVTATLSGTNNIATVTAVTAITNALPAGANLLGKVGIDQTTPVTTNGVVITPASVAGAAITPVVTSALATSLVLKNSAGNLYSLNIAADSTLSGAPWWAMIHNATSAPAAGAVTPVKCYAMASGTTLLALDFSVPIRFGTGISVTVGTTSCFTQTDSAHAFVSGDVQ